MVEPYTRTFFVINTKNHPQLNYAPPMQKMKTYVTETNGREFTRIYYI